MNNSSFFAGRGELINSFDFFKMGSTSKFNSALQRYNLVSSLLWIFPFFWSVFTHLSYIGHGIQGCYLQRIKKKCNMES